eukprot:1235541-Prymnesium_polylepis.1
MVACGISCHREIDATAPFLRSHEEIDGGRSNVATSEVPALNVGWDHAVNTLRETDGTWDNGREH